MFETLAPLRCQGVEHVYIGFRQAKGNTNPTAEAVLVENGMNGNGSTYAFMLPATLRFRYAILRVHVQ